MKGPPEQREERPLLAAVFDLDGVVTRTARLHIASWTQLFDGYLRSRAERFGERFRPFDPGADYRAYVDGRPRYEGVHAFLTSRGIHIPAGVPEDGPEAETEAGLGNRKNALFQQRVEQEGVELDGAAVALFHALRARLAGRQLAVFLDDEGTLTPIVSRPEQALLSEEMRQTLRRLSAVWPCYILSGRGLEEVRGLVGLDSLGYAGSHGFKKAHGTKVFELRPALAWDKGKALSSLQEATGLQAALPLYLGDDTTDEDAFLAVAGRGLGILVTELPRPTAASHSLQNTEEVRELLERLCSLHREKPP